MECLLDGSERSIRDVKSSGQSKCGVCNDGCGDFRILGVAEVEWENQIEEET